MKRRCVELLCVVEWAFSLGSEVMGSIWMVWRKNTLYELCNLNIAGFSWSSAGKIQCWCPFTLYTAGYWPLPQIVTIVGHPHPPATENSFQIIGPASRRTNCVDAPCNFIARLSLRSKWKILDAHRSRYAPALGAWMQGFRFNVVVGSTIKTGLVWRSGHATSAMRAPNLGMQYIF